MTYQNSQKIKKILIINPFGIGDVLFTTPLIRNIKENFKNVSIGYLANARTKCILENHPDINRVFVYEKDYFLDLWKKSKLQCIKSFLRLLGEIRHEKYDTLIDLSLGRQYSFFMMLIGIRRRWGFSYKNRGNFLTRKMELAGYSDKHVVEYYLELLNFLGIKAEKYPSLFPITDGEKNWARNFVKLNGLEGKKIIVIVPGGGKSWGQDRRMKLWDCEKFAKVAARLNGGDNRVVLAGDENDMDLCRKIMDVLNNSVISLCAKTTLGEFAALCSICDLVICNDGGCLHIAVASGARTLSLFGPVDEKVYGPYPMVGHKVARSSVKCRPCYKGFKYSRCEHLECLSNVKWEDVYQEALEILK